MSLRSELEAWAATVGGDPLTTEMGQVVDNHYEERKLVVDPYLGVSVAGDVVTADFTASGLRAEIMLLARAINDETKEW
jgi:uncharacterized protein (UPF0218 family)